MAASSEIRFRIGADTSSLQRGFIEAETRAAQFGKALDKRLGAKDAFKGLVAGLGLGITELSTTIARAFAGLSEETERSLNAIVASTDRARQALDSQLKGRRTAGQNVAFNESDQARLQKELAEIQALKPMRAEQRFISGMPGIGPRLEHALGENGFRTHAKEERAAEISAELAQLAGEKEALENSKRDEARRRKDADQAEIAARTHAMGGPAPSDFAKILELKRQENSLRDEAAEKTTSQARREQLVFRADQLVTQQLLLQGQLRDAELATTERIKQFLRSTFANGETKGEAILRLKREALEADKKSADLSRSEDQRRAFRVEAADKMAAAAKAEYDWKVGTANLENARHTPGGRTNTTGQGQLANDAAKYRQLSDQARGAGRFDEAKRYRDMADKAEADFSKNDSRGMSGSSSLPHYGFQENATPKSSWDKKYGDQIADRNGRLKAVYGEWGKKTPGMEYAEDRDRVYNDRFHHADPDRFVRPKSFMDAEAARQKREGKTTPDEAVKNVAADLKTAAQKLSTAGDKLNDALKPVEM